MPVAAGHFGHQAMAHQRSPAQARQIGRCSAFIQEHQMLQVDARQALMPEGPCRLYILPILLGRVDDFFLKDNSSFLSARQMRLTWTFTLRRD